MQIRIDRRLGICGTATGVAALFVVSVACADVRQTIDGEGEITSFGEAEDLGADITVELPDCSTDSDEAIAIDAAPADLDVLEADPSGLALMVRWAPLPFTSVDTVTLGPLNLPYSPGQVVVRKFGGAPQTATVGKDSAEPIQCGDEIELPSDISDAIALGTDVAIGYQHTFSKATNEFAWRDIQSAAAAYCKNTYPTKPFASIVDKEVTATIGSCKDDDEEKGLALFGVTVRVRCRPASC